MANKKRVLKPKSISPVFMVVIMIVIIMIASMILSLLGFEGQKAIIVSLKNSNLPYGVEMTLTTIKNIFSVEGFKFFISNATENLTTFRPLVLLVISLIGIGIGEASGLFKAWFVKFRKFKPSTLTFLVILLGIIGTFFGDYSYILLLPLVGVMYKHAGRSPMLGILTVFIGITIGYGAGVIFNYNDYLLGLTTQIAANLERDNGYVYSIYSSIYIMLGSTAIISLFGTNIIENFLAPKFSKKLAPEEDNAPVNKMYLWFANFALLIMVCGVIYSILPGLPFSGFMLDKTQDQYIAKLMSDSAPFKDGFIYLVTLVFMVCGFVYGFLTKKFKDNHDYNLGLAKGFDKLGYLFVLMFFTLQMLAILQWTNIGEVVAASLINFVGVLQFSGLPLIVTFFVVVVMISLLMPSLVNKWALMAPVAIPLFMRSNITPDFTQFIFKVADGVGKGFTPLFVYFLIMLGFLQKYNEDDYKITIFGTLKLVIPSILMITGLWILIILGWYIVGLPMGIGTYPTL